MCCADGSLCEAGGLKLVAGAGKLGKLAGCFDSHVAWWGLTLKTFGAMTNQVRCAEVYVSGRSHRHSIDLVFGQVVILIFLFFVYRCSC